MKTRVRIVTLVVQVLVLVSAPCFGKNSSEIVKQRERNTISLELEFTKKSPSALQKMISFLNWGPNGYATGFLVGDHLVMTAYHVVSGNIDDSKKIALGFGRGDELQARVFTNGCQAKVLKVDEAADLALLEVCGISKQASSLPFQLNLSKDETLLLIARPHGDRVIGQGTFSGPYSMNGVEYWSGKLTARDGFSGSPVYNEKGEIVGVFSGYDWTKKVAVISPGNRVQKLLEEYSAKPGP
ncbi:MAG TPA: serine protease [Pyrinomonadaceae bacterium]|nr:serine protease [Pyrinomonadaceae bacterium]